MKPNKSDASDRRKKGVLPALCFARVFKSGDEQPTESKKAPYMEDLSDTQSLTIDDLSLQSLTITSEDSRIYGYGFAVPDHDEQFIRENELKLAGTKWKRASKHSDKYLQLNFVSQDTVVLARRAPSPSRSRQRVVMIESFPAISPLRIGPDTSDSSIRSSRRRVSMTNSRSSQRANVRRHYQL